MNNKLSDRRQIMSAAFDWTCLIHGKKMSEHPPYGCLYCCLCFCDLTPDTCHVRSDGTKEDICNPCAEQEKQLETNRLQPIPAPPH